PESDEGRKKLNELTELCTKLSEKVKHLEDQLKSTTKRRKEKVVISHEEEDLVSEDPSKQERISKTKYGNGETEHVEEESSEVHLDVLKRVSKATPEEEPTEDMEKALWVDMKRLFEPDKDDVLWKLQRYIYCQLQLWL
ncbi:hypothetical protein Tco_0036905, partial [Tanacetum coccineum]